MSLKSGTAGTALKKNYQSTKAQEILDAIRSCLPTGREGYPLHEPTFNGNEWQYTKECLDTGWISSVGKFVDKFEQCLREYTEVASAVAVVNGTAALHIALQLAGVKRDDEVLVPTVTFVATANAITYCGAVPHFVDSIDETLGVSPFKLEEYLKLIAAVKDGHLFNRTTGRRIKALIVMHTFGHPAHLQELAEICQRYHIELIEDAAEALGSTYHGRHVGYIGKLAILSFNGNKTVTTGGGGAVLTNDAELGRHAKHLTTTAKVPHAWQFFHDETGYNYRLPNINAAVGLAQMEQLPWFLSKKRTLAEKYKAAISEIDGVKFLKEPGFAKSNYWLNAFILEDGPDSLSTLELILELSNRMSIQTRPLWEPMHTLPMYKQCPRMDLSNAESLRRRVITIPSGASLVE